MSTNPFHTDNHMTAASANVDARDSLRHLAVATVVTLVLWFVPFVGIVLFPIRLFVTYVHEICHAAASVLTLGWPLGIEIYWDASGVTQTTNLNLVVASAGYVGTTIVGAVLLLLAARRLTVRPALAATGMTLVVATLWLGANPLAWIAGLGLGATLVAIGLKASPRAARFALSFLALQCMLNALSDLKTLFFLSVASEAQTDARNMAMATGGWVPAVFWTALWALVSLAVLGLAGRAYYRATVARVMPS